MGKLVIGENELACQVMYARHHLTWIMVVTGTDGAPIYHARGYMEAGDKQMLEFLKNQAQYLSKLYAVPGIAYCDEMEEQIKCGYI